MTHLAEDEVNLAILAVPPPSSVIPETTPAASDAIVSGSATAVINSVIENVRTATAG